MKKVKIGLIGYGSFGKFIDSHLSKYFEVSIFDPSYEKSLSLKEVCDCDYLIFAVTINNLEKVCKDAKKFVKTDTKIIDVTSVKIKPIEILQKHFPKNEILGTHPIFGPQSGKDGVQNLPIVLCNLSFSAKNYLLVKKFLTEKMKLNILEKTAEQHDKEMAYVQGLSHFIGRALSMMKIENFDSATKSYKQLVSLESLLGGDSLDLYRTIQNANPHAKKVRKEFLKTLNDLENKTS